MAYLLKRITPDEMRIAAAGVIPLPVEQSFAWDRFDESCGRKNWGRYAFSKDDRTIAVISLSEYELRGVRYLWAKKGPVWLHSQSPDTESAFQQALVREVRKRDPKIVFIRLHAKYSAPYLHDLVQTITYDRTILIDTKGGDEQALIEALPKDGRRSVRRSVKRMEEAGAQAVELTGLTREQFDPVYAVLEETAKRDRFSIHPADVYWQMLNALGPEHARLFGVKQDEEIIAWVLVLVNDQHAYAYYGAHSAKARDVLASEYLDFWVAKTLGAEGVVSLDLMGVDSTRCPDLYNLGIYKRRFAQTTTEVDGAWDLPIIAPAYRALVLAKRGKEGAQVALGAAKRFAKKVQFFAK